MNIGHVLRVNIERFSGLAFSAEYKVRHQLLARRNPRRHDGELQWISKHVALTDSGVYRVIDRKSTRLNSSHVRISYAVFCLKKKKKKKKPVRTHNIELQVKY